MPNEKHFVKNKNDIFKSKIVLLLFLEGAEN